MDDQSPSGNQSYPSLKAPFLADPALHKAGQRVYLVRSELNQILNVYGRMVAAGQWRDYTIDAQPDYAAFSIFRRTSEVPLYQIIKDPTLARRQGMWRIVAMNGQIVKRGKKLPDILRYFDRLVLKAVKS